MKNNMVIISTKDKPIWQIVLAALFFTVAIYLVGLFFYSFTFEINEERLNRTLKILPSILIFTLGGISFSQKHTMLFDLENKRFKGQFSVGPFKVGKWQDLPSLDYVSVFKNTKDFFEINLWYAKNKHFNVYMY